MRITIIGAGYVGLTTGATLAYIGHQVVLLDCDGSKISMLEQGRVPIFEPHLAEFLTLAQSRLRFTTTAADALSEAEVVFIAVGTPPLPDGKPDLSALRSAARTVGQHLGEGFTVLVNKSTVPIGSGNWVDGMVRDCYAAHHGRKRNGDLAVASNPEFLREGVALHDSLYPDRIVIGCDSQRGREVLYNVYRPILEQTFPVPTFLPRPEGLGAIPLISAELSSAELIKYAANAFLALKVSFINEIASLSECVGADVTQIARGIGLDSRIGTRFLEAGAGWGGSCFGKDTAALVATGKDYGLSMPIVAAARDVNYRQRDRVVEKLLAELKILKGRCIAILGVAFKPHTDDFRDSAALDIARRLMDRDATVRLHDPVVQACKLAAHDPELGACLMGRVEEAVEDADAVVLITEWPEYRELPWDEIGDSMRTRLLLDGRNFLHRPDLEGAGFRVLGVGR